MALNFCFQFEGHLRTLKFGINLMPFIRKAEEITFRILRAGTDGMLFHSNALKGQCHVKSFV